MPGRTTPSVRSHQLRSPACRCSPLVTVVRRALITVEDPSTGQRVPVKQLKEYDEWLRRREAGEEEEDVGVYPGDEMEMDRGSDGDGDD